MMLLLPRNIVHQLLVMRARGTDVTVGACLMSLWARAREGERAIHMVRCVHARYSHLIWSYLAHMYVA